MKDWDHALQNLPPDLTLVQAARLLNRGYDTTRRHLQMSGYRWRDGRHLRYAFEQPRSRVPWNKVDWRQSNIEISRKHGVCRELVRRMRNRFGKDKVESRGAKPKEYYASKNSTAAEKNGHLRPSPRKGVHEMPAQRRGARIQPQARRRVSDAQR